MGDKVAILGTVPNSRVVVPFNDPSWDVWLCSAGNSQAAAPPRINEWFEIHALVDLHSSEHQGWYGPYIEWLNKQTFPVWMQEPNEDVPRAQVFPWKALIKEFGPDKKRTNWFTSSPAWMFAFAIMRGYKTIGIFGVDMAAAEEHYTGQRAGLLRWFEIGRERGIKVICPLESTLAFDYPLYGYAEASRHGRALVQRETDLKGQIAQINNQIGLLQRELFSRQGALDQVTFDRRTYVTGLDAELDDPFEGQGFGVAERLSTDKSQAPPQMEGNFVMVPAESVRTKPPTADQFKATPEMAAILESANPVGKANGPTQVGPTEVAEG